ncbi:MAG TPA: S9 family peptidase [Kofleriaceae bacterium]
MKLVLATLCALAGTAAAKGLTIDDMLAMQRVGDPVVSPRGDEVAFTLSTPDLDANRSRSDIWVAGIDGAGARRMTSAPQSDSDPAWSRDGAWLYFLSTRSGSSQVWRMHVTGGEAEQVTKLPVDLNGFRVFPDGQHLLLAADVYPDAHNLAGTAARDAAKEKSKVKARIYDQLLFRHWDTWEDGKFSHLFVWDPSHADDARDITPGLTTDTPEHPFGGMEETDISPDGKLVAYVARASGRENAWRTNTDVYLVAADGRTRPVDVTVENKAYDFSPVFSPDGKTLAVTQMARPGFESDRLRISLFEVATRKRRLLTEKWDRSPGNLAWSADGRTIYADTDNLGNHSIFAVDVGTGEPKLLVDKGENAHATPAGDKLVYSHDSLKQPAELYTMLPDGSGVKQLTHFNDARVKAIQWGDYQQFSFKGAKGDTVYGYVFKPSGFSGAKVPVAFLIHGGPQGSFDDHFHYRWNPEVFAGHGYGVVMIDFHGSTGYGQAFTDAISNDWGGAPYDDLMMGLDAALAKYPWLDKTRMTALGASYGGFMINWINGKTDRFKALVCHDGNIDEVSAYYDTEELWFPEWEHGGVPWENHAGYVKHTPIDLVKNWKTPTLVVHGALDFRIPDTQGMSTFTALQRKGVPSRFLHFPDENHWVLKPQNSKLWHDEVFAWIDKWTGLTRR